MATKQVKIRINVGPAAEAEAGNGRADMGAVLDMLRYAGLLCNNAPRGHIEYTTEPQRALSQIERWRSFGMPAEIVKER